MSIMKKKRLWSRPSAIYSSKCLRGKIFSNTSFRKAKKIDRKNFENWDWKVFYELVDGFVYPQNRKVYSLHTQQQNTIPLYLELVKRARRHFNVDEFDKILDEFTSDLKPWNTIQFLRSLRYVALFLPTANLASEQFERIMTLLKPDGIIASCVRTQSQVDVFYSYILRRLTKGNPELVRKFDWTSYAELVFDHIVPVALKIPAPLKGARKLPKLVSKHDEPNAQLIFESLEDNVAINVAKWVVPCLNESKQTIMPKLMFTLTSLKNLCHPSNHGAWIGCIESFLLALTGSLSTMVQENADFELKRIEPLVDAIWSLLEMLVFSKSGTGSTGNFTSCIIGKYLANIDPKRIVPFIMDLVSASLDSLTEPHRTTSAIGLLCMSMTSLLNYEKTSAGMAPTILLLPTIAQGIDSNDQIKSIFTFALFSNFATSARIEDLSELPSNDFKDWNDNLQMAKETTSQFIDIALLFTENLISYLKAFDSSDSGHAGIDPTIAKLVISIAETFYSQLSDSIMSICMEKWLDFFWSDCSPASAEVVGEIAAIASEAAPKLVDELLSSAFQRIQVQLERGAGSVGTLPQANRTLLCHLALLSSLFERAESLVCKHFNKFCDLLSLMNPSIGNHFVYEKVAALINIVIISLSHIRVKASAPKFVNNPFENWGRWTKAEDLKNYVWIFPSEHELEYAFNLLFSQIEVAAKKIQELRAQSLENKSTVEGYYCVFAALENLSSCAQTLAATYSAQDNGFNGQIANENLYSQAVQALERIGKMFVDMASIFTNATSNVDLTNAYYKQLGKYVNNRGAHPARNGNVITSFKRLGVYLKRHPNDQTLPPRLLLKTVMAYRSFRRDYRLFVGDSRLDLILSAVVDPMREILFYACFCKYRSIRLSAQSALLNYTMTNSEYSKAMVEKSLALIEEACKSDSGVSEQLFKGFCFGLQHHSLNMIASCDVLYSRFCRLIITLNERPDVQNIHDSVSILQVPFHSVTEVIVPCDRFKTETTRNMVIKMLFIID